jgi:predicted ATPase
VHVSAIRLTTFKRFTNLSILDIPRSARLILLAGPNGTGKSSLFDGFKVWHHVKARVDSRWEVSYHSKVGLPDLVLGEGVEIDFHEEVPTTEEERKKVVYVRSAYRNEPEFAIRALERRGDVYTGPNIGKLIENDVKVSDNYQRLVSETLEGVYSRQFDSLTVPELREAFIGQVRDSMRRVFADLLLEGPGDPLEDGTFTFEKGISRGFKYKNLSGGEKAAFDLVLDLIVKRQTYDNTVYCIDEPDLHINTALQGRLLEELVSLLPNECQLWLATHSIGMMRKAQEMKELEPDSVVFLDFQGHDFDEPVELRPVSVTRDFWTRTLEVALGDLAALVAPRRVVLCEGKPGSGDSRKAEFDARCYRIIFGDRYPDTDFLSVGNAADVGSDRLEVGRTIQTLVSGTEVLRLVDRDDRSDAEIEELRANGVRVLRRRHIESYLLDDEVLTRLCETKGQPEKVAAVLGIKQDALKDSYERRGNQPDDLKSAAGDVFTHTVKALALVGAGNDTQAFLRDTLAPLVPGTVACDELRQDIFG